MAVPSISFSGFFDGYSDRDRQIAEERQREQDRITWMNAEADREKKRLMAEEALRRWGLVDVAASREAEAIGKARNTLWTEKVMSGVRDNLSPEEVARVRLAEAQAKLRRDAAMIAPMDAGTSALGVAPSRFDPYARELENSRAGLGGAPTVAALQALLGQDAATSTEGGISLPGGMTITDAQAQRLLGAGVGGVVADEIAREKEAMAILDRSASPAKENPNIRTLQTQIKAWQGQLENTRDPAEKARLTDLIRRADAELLTMLPIPKTPVSATPASPSRVDVSPAPQAQVAQPASTVAQPAATAKAPAASAPSAAQPAQKTPPVQASPNEDQRVIRSREWITEDMRVLASQFKSKQDELRTAAKSKNPQEVLRLASELQLIRSKVKDKIGGNAAEPFIMKALGL